jgi:hypothetical protein
MIQEPERPEVWLVLDGVRRHIPNPDTLNGLFNSWDIVKRNNFNISDGPQMQNLTKLIKAPNHVNVYLIIDGTKRHINDPKTFNHFNFDWKKIHV